jgi:hypothetical protein
MLGQDEPGFGDKEILTLLLRSVYRQFTPKLASAMRQVVSVLRANVVVKRCLEQQDTAEDDRQYRLRQRMGEVICIHHSLQANGTGPRLELITCLSAMRLLLQNSRLTKWTDGVEKERNPRSSGVFPLSFLRTRYNLGLPYVAKEGSNGRAHDT